MSTQYGQWKYGTFVRSSILSVRFAAHAPHQYLLGAAISPPGCIPGRYAPKTQLLLKIGSGIFPFQFCASWRTSSDNSCHPAMFPNFLFCFVFKGLELLVPHCAGRTRILCLRFTAVVRLCSQIPSTTTAPPAAQDSIGVGG
jgi:hypothetical protein